MLNDYSRKLVFCTILVLILHGSTVSSFVPSLAWRSSCSDRSSLLSSSHRTGNRVCDIRHSSPRRAPVHITMATTEPEKIVVSAHDGHEISLWKKGPANGKPIVLLHGRTWSARPVWDLQVGSPPRDGASYLGANTMDLMASRGWLVFAPDFRGLGGTKRDEEGWTTPNKCVSDVLAVLDYLAKEGHQKPPLVGWSQARGREGAAMARTDVEVAPGCSDRAADRSEACRSHLPACSLRLYLRQGRCLQPSLQGRLQQAPTLHRKHHGRRHGRLDGPGDN
mmetsp:Transcript_3729/g.13393  ORF Transcript_3729/g.13393 Transcript_3729/m.13393 type:complete len:279 (-) Transcript_3729:1689-2525(-)